MEHQNPKNKTLDVHIYLCSLLFLWWIVIMWLLWCFWIFSKFSGPLDRLMVMLQWSSVRSENFEFITRILHHSWIFIMFLKDSKIAQCWPNDSSAHCEKKIVWRFEKCTTGKHSSSVGDGSGGSRRRNELSNNPAQAAGKPAPGR